MRPRPADRTPAPRAFGSIAADEAMLLAEFGRRLNLAERAQSEAQHQGLRTIVFGRCKYVLGKDVLAWLESLGAQQAQADCPEGGCGNGCKCLQIKQQGASEVQP